MIGLNVSHYKILEKLGEGGMGVVYKATDTNLDRTVALKFLPAQVVSGNTEKQRFINEAKSASALDHPNVCTVFAIDETEDGSLFIVMAYYDGADLNQMIKNGPLPIREVIQLSLQIASGLQKAHEKGIIHRDLKPGNIFITKDNIVKIIDFGLAKAPNHALLTKTGSTLGTFPYMSPEQAKGEKADHRSDIWSMGVMIFEMITGLRPFKSEYESALVYSILNEDPLPVTSLRSGVPMELERIVNKCLEKEPSDRYQNLDDLIVDLKRAERELSTGSKTVATPLVTQPNRMDPEKTEKHRTKPLLVAVAGLFMILPFIYYFTVYRSSDIQQLTRSIAVLPLENLSPDPDDAYFAAGIHEDIIIQLSQIADLQVIARSSVLGYSAGQRNIQNISSELGVESVLEGSVRRAANRVRVTVTLTDILTNRTLWANTFDRDLNNIFAIQSEIALEIARALETRLSTREEAQIALQPTENATAYELYLRARDYFNQPGAQENNLRIAQNLLSRSLLHDENFAHAYALLSRVYISLYWFNHDRSEEILNRALFNAEKAIEIQPGLADTHVAMGYYYYHGHRNYDRALEYFNTALGYQPNNADIISSIGFVERRLGNFEESIRMVEKALTLDPLNLPLIFNNAQSYMLIRRHEDAERDYLRVLEFAPNLATMKVLIALNRILWKADIDAVLSFFDENPNLREVVTGDWMRLKMLIGDFDGVLRTLEEVPKDLYEGQLFLFTPTFLKALAVDISKNNESARMYYQQALKEYRSMDESYYEDPRYRAALGRIHAGLGDSEQAIYHGNAAVSIIVEMVDALEAPPYKNELAYIYTTLGMTTEAVEVLRELLENPGYITIPRLNLEPAWDPIRNTPEFRALIREFDQPI